MFAPASDAKLTVRRRPRRVRSWVPIRSPIQHSSSSGPPYLARTAYLPVVRSRPDSARRAPAPGSARLRSARPRCGPGARSAPRSSSAGGPRRSTPPCRRAPGSGRRPGGRRVRRGCPGTTSTTSTPVRSPQRSAGAGRKRARAPGDAEEAAANAALGHQGTDDLAGRRVDRHRQAEPEAGDGRVDADHLSPAVGERALRSYPGSGRRRSGSRSR